MDAKYIVIEQDGEELMFAFPATISHAHMLEAVRTTKQGVFQHWTRPYRDSKLVSAGFINIHHDCYGESETLNIKSRGDVDTDLRIAQYHRIIPKG
jgi:hypothetical protein